MSGLLVGCGEADAESKGDGGGGSAGAGGSTGGTSQGGGGGQAPTAMIGAEPTVSADGRFVAFLSWAEDLVADDTNGTTDVFVWDTEQGLVTRASVSCSGEQADAYSENPNITTDGRYVVFTSPAENLGGHAQWHDVYVHDRDTGETAPVITTYDGQRPSWPTCTDDDQCPRAFCTDSGYCSRQGWGEELAGVSDDGRFVAYATEASNVTPGDHNRTRDVFLVDREQGTTGRVTVEFPHAIYGDLGPSYAPTISANGRILAFESRNQSLIYADGNSHPDVFWIYLQSGGDVEILVPDVGAGTECPFVSADGHHIAFWSKTDDLVAGDQNNSPDVFIRHLDGGELSLVSVLPSGQPAGASVGGSMSADGRFVLFVSPSDPLGHTEPAQLYVRDVQGAATAMVAPLHDTTPGHESFRVDAHDFVISADGRHIVFASRVDPSTGRYTGQDSIIYRVPNPLLP